MKSGHGFMSVLKVLGISPGLGFAVLFGILVIGMMFGLCVKNARKPRPVRPPPAAYAPAPELEPAPAGPAAVEPAVEKPVPGAEAPAEPPADSRVPFARFALPVPAGVEEPVLAIIIDDMGTDMIRSNQILKLGYPLTASYFPHAPNLQEQVDSARASGHEVMLHVPMEAMSEAYSADYGPEYLSTSSSRGDNVRLLENMLSRASGYVGLNNHMGSRFTLDAGQMMGVFEELARRGLAFVDSKTSATRLDGMAEAAGIAYASRDVFLDDSGDEEDIRKSLALLEGLAGKRGWAIAIGHPRPNTIRLLSEWLPTLEDKGLTLVPVSYIIRKYGIPAR